MDNIRYSIITPVFNREDCIARCMESVIRNQNEGFDGEFEHIIVDDGSSDSTASIVEEYAQQHPHVVLVKFNNNRGTNAARNEAIRRARGEWCIILDSDDYFVDDALQTITETMEAKPGYKHYMFAPDDMQGYYAQNAIIRGAEQKVLTYPDFLNGYVGGDFIHVCNTEILRHHPFDERLRIYEGVFFLMFFRDAQQMLFTNKVVTIRERSRADSVTREVIRTNRKVIERTIKANELLLYTFRDDYERLGMRRQLRNVQMTLYENYILVGNYVAAYKIQRTLKNGKSMKFGVLKYARLFHLGMVYRIMLSTYLKIKYGFLKKRLE